MATASFLTPHDSLGDLAPLPASHPVQQTPAIWHPDAPREGWTVVHFRRRFTLDAAVADAHVWVTASERFILYLDGQLIARGPTRADPQRWATPRVALGDLAAGEHVLAVCVFHFGPHAGMGQTGGPAFLLAHGEGLPVDTGAGWTCRAEDARTPIDRHTWPSARYYVVGAGETIDAARVPWGWEAPGYDDADWAPARVVCGAAADIWGNRPLAHELCADPLPPMRETEERFARLEREAPAEPIASPSGARASSRAWEPDLGARGDARAPAVIPPHTTVRLLFDRGELTNAYPVLTVSGGAGARMEAVWAEAPYDDDGGRAKSNRDETAGKHFYGHRDTFLPDGGARRALTTLWFRAFRYLELTVTTADEALTLDEMALLATGYPLTQQSRFTPDADHAASYAKLEAVSWRTAQLCAHETFFDCPHYEQCQFEGDTRVQAVYHFLLADDDRLARKAIDDFRGSQLADGLTQCRWPSTRVQILPTFSLLWIGMMHDLRVYRGHGDFLARMLPHTRGVLDWFARRLRPDGLLGHIEHAPFTDWTADFTAGNAPQDPDGGSAILSLLFAQACNWQASLENYCGYPELSPRWRMMASSLTEATGRLCWDEGRGLLANTPSKATASLHGQIFAILAGLWDRPRAAEVLGRALADPTVTPLGSFYFRYYLAQAFKATGMREGFFAILPLWERALVGTGLTTWPESDGQARSDCHAWSVTPSIEFLQTVLGIEPDPMVPGFQVATFAPTLGPLTTASGEVPTPHGTILVDLQRVPEGTLARLTTPIPLVAGTRTLAPGRHEVVV